MSTIPERLKQGDTIGIVSPSSIADPDRFAKIRQMIEKRGFKVKLGENISKDTYGYLASERERAGDFNNMAADEEIKMVFFGGGDGAIEILPLIDYDAIKRNPKIFSSYSDGTSILNAIHAKTGLVTYYGQSPTCFEDLRLYDYEQFFSHFVYGNAAEFEKNGEWTVIRGGKAEGALIGGYAGLFALLQNSEYLPKDETAEYTLFLEDHELFSKIAMVSMYLSWIERHPFIGQVRGLLFGHYSETVYPDLMERFKRFGDKHKIPVVYCDDFGHGKNHAILPIGAEAALDADGKTLKFK
jgi:muramoyltetrapeptide carboxypeptidase